MKTYVYATGPERVNKSSNEVDTIISVTYNKYQCVEAKIKEILCVSSFFQLPILLLSKISFCFS